MAIADIFKKLTTEEVEAFTGFVLKQASPFAKHASDQGVPWWEDPQEIQKLAQSGIPDDHLEALVKEAARQQDLNNVFTDYDCAGRVMAHGFYDELFKLSSVRLEQNAADTKTELLKNFLAKKLEG